MQAQMQRTYTNTGARYQAPVSRYAQAPAQVAEKQNLPLKKFKIGAISATVWENQGKDHQGQAVSYKNVSFERAYKDAKGEWQTTTTLRAADLPKAILVLNKAYEFMAFNDSAVEME